jgi:hypothetical protein
MTSCDCGECDVCAPYWEDTFPNDDTTSEPHSPNSGEIVCGDCGEDCEGESNHYCPEREEREAKEEAEDMQRILDKLDENTEKIFGEDTKL